MDAEELGERLRGAPLEVVGQFVDASNTTLLVRLLDRDPRDLAAIARQLGREVEVGDLDPDDLAVSKPARGERPLRDFPHGTLHRREVAAHVVDAALGWDLVPRTELREDGPLGVGSIQRFVPHDPQAHYFTLLDEGDPDVLEQLRRMVVLDVVLDNADRKGGHVLVEVGPDAVRRVRVVDHGVTFNVVRKLRTVAWDFAGERVAPALLADLDRLREALVGDLGARLALLLADDEVAALQARVVALLASPVLPAPWGERPYPWPLL